MRWVKIVLSLLCTIVVCFTINNILYTYKASRSTGPAPRQVAPPSSQPPPIASAPPAPSTSSASKTVLPTPKPPSGSVRDQHWEASKILSEAVVFQQETLKHINRWNTEVETVGNGPLGTAIAASDDLVAMLANVRSQPRPTERDVRVLGEQIDQLKKRLDTAAAQPNPELLTAREMYEIRDVQTKAESANNAWQGAVTQALAIVARASELVNPVATPSLEEKLTKIETDKVLEELETDGSQESPGTTIPRPTQASTLSHQESATRPSVPATIASTPPVAEPIPNPVYDPELRAKALAPGVRSTLTPFLETRTIQPSLVGTFSIRWKRTVDKAPMSLASLEAIGALEDSVEGLKKLALVGGNRKLPEPRWSVATQPANWSDSDQELLKKAQQMLRDYGEILVAEGLLSP